MADDTVGASKAAFTVLIAIALVATIAGAYWFQKIAGSYVLRESINIESIWIGADHEEIQVHVTLVNEGSVPAYLDSILINDQPIKNYPGASAGEFTLGLELRVGASKSGTMTIPYGPPFTEGMMVKIDVVTSTDNHHPFFITVPARE